jgi:hypothetical protein
MITGNSTGQWGIETNGKWIHCTDVIVMFNDRNNNQKLFLK